MARCVMRAKISGGLAILLLVACSSAANFWVTVVFPDEEARQNTTSVEVFAITPGQGATCDTLIAGTAKPGDADYEIADRIEADYPSAEGSRSLNVIGRGEMLFFARALDVERTDILRGCTRAGAGAAGPYEVVVTLTWSCRETNNGVELCDGQDNDCDGQTDEDCITPCQQDDDCDDEIACTTDTCEAGTCLFTPDDTACPDDDVYCNGQEICDAENGCVGSGDPCLAGSLVCDEMNNQCVACLLDDDCDDGVDCTDDTCNVAAGTCVFTQNDANCSDDGLYCNGTEICDAVKGCIGSGDPCAAGGQPCDEQNDVCVSCGDGIASEVEDCDPAAPQNDNCCDMVTCTWTAAGSADPQGLCSGAPECKIDVCDGAGVCTVADETDGAACTGDGVFCNGTEECRGGSCSSPGNPCSDPSDCDESNDVCQGCGDGVVSSGEQCDPAAPAGDHCCNTTTCQWIESGEVDPQGVCAGAPECRLDACDGSGGCTFANATSGTPCTDDGLFCTGTESCDGVGSCASSGDPCPGTECNTCQEATDSCFDPPTTACTDDGLFCNGPEQCNGVGACAGTGDPCPGTTCNTCQEATASCFDAAGAACTDDDLFCTGAEQCDGSGTCVSTGNPCVIPADCDEMNDNCGG